MRFRKTEMTIVIGMLLLSWAAQPGRAETLPSAPILKITQLQRGDLLTVDVEAAQASNPAPQVVLTRGEAAVDVSLTFKVPLAPSKTERLRARFRSGQTSANGGRRSPGVALNVPKADSQLHAPVRRHRNRAQVNRGNRLCGEYLQVHDQAETKFVARAEAQANAAMSEGTKS